NDLRIEHVHDVAGEQAEVMLRAGEDFFHDRIAGVERAFDHAARHAVLSALLHDLENGTLARGADISLHRRPARQRLHTPSASAAARRTIFLDDHVADLAGSAAKSLIDFAVDNEPAADARPHPHTHGALRPFRGAV